MGTETLESSRGAAHGGARPSVLVHYEPCASGRRALAEALALTDDAGCLTIVTLAPQAGPRCCSRGGDAEYNCAVRDEARLELREARELLGSAAERADFQMLVERRDAPFAEWAAQRDFDVVLLAAHRLTREGNSHARRLRRATAAQVRVIS